MITIKADKKTKKKLKEEDKKLTYEILKGLNIGDTSSNEEDIEKEDVKVNRKKILFLRKEFVYLFLVLFVIFGGYSGAKILLWSNDARSTEKQIDEINNEVNVEEVNDTEDTIIVNPPKEEEIQRENPYWDYIKMNLINVDFSKLKSINSDTVGWIKVNGTNINYPFVQTNDNTYYLKKDFNKKYNSAGWVFMDYRNNVKDFDKNTILYAHGRIDGTMFGSLKNITKSNWYNNSDNHVVKLSTEYENTLWQVFSIYRIPEVSDYLNIDFNNNEEYVKFLEMLQNRSEYKFDVSLNEEDKILTLSTCYKENDRVVLHAKLIKMEVRNGNN